MAELNNPEKDGSEEALEGAGSNRGCSCCSKA